MPITPRFLLLALAVMGAAFTLGHLQKGSFYEGALWAPIGEETLKFLALLIVIAKLRQRNLLGATWREESRRVAGYALLVGLVFSSYEFITSYYGEPYLHRFLRHVAHPTYTLTAVTAALYAWKRGWPGAFWWGVALGAVPHGVFNSVGAWQGVVLAVALPVAAGMAVRMRGWGEGPEGWRRMTTLGVRAPPQSEISSMPL